MYGWVRSMHGDPPAARGLTYGGVPLKLIDNCWLPFTADTRDVCTRYGIQVEHEWNLELPKHTAERPDRNLRTQRFTTLTRS